MGVNDPQEVANLHQKGHGWQDLCRTPLIIAKYKIC